MMERVASKIDAHLMYSRLPKETVGCNFCKSDQYLKEILNRDRYGMGIVTVLCQRCGFLFTNPRPTQEGMNEFYRTIYRQFYTGSDEPEKEYKEELHVRKRQWLYEVAEKALKHRNSPSPAVLDVGCGAGVLLSVFKSNLSQVRLFGVEPTPAFAEYTAKKNGATVFPVDLDTFLKEHRDLMGTFDLIVLNHVLEHLYDPLDKLMGLRDFLAPAGLLLIQVPNLLSPHWEKPLPMFHIAHVNHFVPSSLRYGFELAGFKVLKEIAISEPVHLKAMTFLCQKAEHAKIPLHTPPPLKETLSVLNIEIEKIRKKTYRQASRNPFVRFVNCCQDRGIQYTKERLVFHFEKTAKSIIPMLNFRQWRRYDSVGGYYHRCKNSRILRRLFQGQKVLLIGTGPSANELQELPTGFKIITCNAALRLFVQRGWKGPVDLFLTRKKATFQDYPDTPDLLAKIKTDILVFDTPNHLRRNSRFDGTYRCLLKDHQKDNSYLNKLIKPFSIEQIKVNEVTWTTAGMRLLQYAIYFGAKEIYLVGIDPQEASYFWGAPFIHKHLIDYNFMKLMAAKHDNIFSFSQNSSITQYFPYKDFKATPP